MKKRIVMIVVVLLVLAAAGAGGWWAWITYGDGATEEVVLGGSGTVEADEVAISSVIAGRITDVLVEEGSRGDLGHASVPDRRRAAAPPGRPGLGRTASR